MSWFIFPWTKMMWWHVQNCDTMKSAFFTSEHVDYDLKNCLLDPQGICYSSGAALVGGISTEPESGTGPLGATTTGANHDI